jgi:hypothetical protein
LYLSLGALPHDDEATLCSLLSLPLCQRETGSSFVLNDMIEADRVALLQGEVEVVNMPSGQLANRFWLGLRRSVLATCCLGLRLGFCCPGIDFEPQH